MPRTKTATSSKRNHQKKRSSGRSKHVTLSSSSKPSSSSYSAQQLVEAAEAALASDTMHAIALYTAALQHCHAKEKQVDPALVLEKRAEARVAAADPEGALDDYRQALQELVEQTETTKSNNNDTNKDSPPEAAKAVTLERQASLLCYMGQLSGGHESLQCYQQAIERLQQRLAILQRQPQQSSSIETTQQHLSAACCGAAEVYLTDLCWEESAEQRCEAWVQQALDAYNPPTLDALQTAASLRLSQCRGLEATQFIQACFARMQVPCEALRRLVGLRHVVNAASAGASTTTLELSPDETTAVQALPGFEFRTQTAKLLLECSAIARDQNTTTAHECAEAAVTVLASLLAENDEVIELWYLCGDAFAALADVELAVYYYQRTAEMLQSVQQSLEQDDDEAQEEQEEEELQQKLDEVTCQLEDVQQKLQALQQQQLQSSEQDNTAEPMDQD